jgi:hypothetical protein
VATSFGLLSKPFLVLFQGLEEKEEEEEEEEEEEKAHLLCLRTLDPLF